MSNLALIVRGRAIDTYHHESKSYVEGRKGTPYEIQFSNTRGERVKIVVSVDGLNITTGDKTWEQGYIVGPLETIKIPGWRKSGTNTAEFEFSSLKSSYNQHNLEGESSSVGVIGCKVFREKQQPVTIFRGLISSQPVYHYYPWVTYWGGPVSPQFSSQTLNVKDDGHTVMNCCMTTPTSAMGTAGGSGMGTAGGSGMGTAGGGGSLRSTADAAKLATPLPKLCADDGPMGTAWGKDHTYNTYKVDFDAEVFPVETFVVYYDSRERLERRGIPVWDPIKTFSDPNPFPGDDGCPNPIPTITVDWARR